MRYSGSDKTSKATKSVIKSLAAGKSIIPATANKVKGKTSVCWRPVCTALFSSSDPGTADACAVK